MEWVKNLFKTKRRSTVWERFEIDEENWWRKSLTERQKIAEIDFQIAQLSIFSKPHCGIALEEVYTKEEIDNWGIEDE